MVTRSAGLPLHPDCGQSVLPYGPRMSRAPHSEGFGASLRAFGVLSGFVKDGLRLGGLPEADWDPLETGLEMLKGAGVRPGKLVLGSRQTESCCTVFSMGPAPPPPPPQQIWTLYKRTARRPPQTIGQGAGGGGRNRPLKPLGPQGLKLSSL